MPLPRWIQAVLVLILVLALGLGPALDVAVDWLWFDQLGQLDLYRRGLLARIAAGLGGALLAALVIGGNLRLASRRAPLQTMRLSLLLAERTRDLRSLPALIRAGMVAFTLGPALVLGSMASANWMEGLQLLHRQPFGVVDPIFGLDLSFFVYVLPAFDIARVFVTLALGATLVSCLGWYALQAVVRNREAPVLHDFARRHLLLLGAALLAVFSVEWFMARYGLLSTQHGAVWGVGYVDRYARLPSFLAMSLLSLGGALGWAWSALRPGWRLPLSVAAAYGLGRVVLIGLLPVVVQELVVEPNELELERPFIEHSIAGTRAAFGLDRVQVSAVAPQPNVDLAGLRAEGSTLDNARLWDSEPLLATWRQLQEIRPYYYFGDVDVDRYRVDGRLRMLALSPRELSAARLPQGARGFVNTHLQYTHGYGLAVSPVADVTAEGLPRLVVQDIPPKITVDLPITRPEIYFGEETVEHVFVRTGIEEFDRPDGDSNQTVQYAGEGGVPMPTFLHKLLFALHLGQADLLLTDYLTPDSRVMLRRQVRSRVSTLLPFLRLDSDPYPVIHEGRLVWMVDGYTTTSRYPYAEPFTLSAGGLMGGRRPGIGPDSFNYIRGATKVTVDAYDGSVHIYVSDPADPMIRTWQAAFPNSFQPLSEMPEGLRAHLRYPADLFTVQSQLYNTYHMVDPTVFYNKEDLWEPSREVHISDGRRQDRDMPAAYTMLTLPGEEEAEMVLLQPYSPAGKDNLIGWLAARCDGPVYGGLVLNALPKQELYYGPRQIESRIDQDADISQQLTLWNQQGSSVQRGNLLVLPIGGALLYVEPLYLQAASGQLPELKRVIVAFDNRIVMRPTLDEALMALFAETGGAALRSPQSLPAPPAADPVAPSAAATGPMAIEVARANAAWQRARERQQAGDWAGYGDAIAELEAALTALQQAVETPAPAAPTPAGG